MSTDYEVQEVLSSMEQEIKQYGIALSCEEQECGDVYFFRAESGREVRSVNRINWRTIAELSRLIDAEKADAAFRKLIPRAAKVGISINFESQTDIRVEFGPKSSGSYAYTMDDYWDLETIVERAELKKAYDELHPQLEGEGWRMIISEDMVKIFGHEVFEDIMPTHGCVAWDEVCEFPMTRRNLNILRNRVANEDIDKILEDIDTGFSELFEDGEDDL